MIKFKSLLTYTLTPEEYYPPLYNNNGIKKVPNHWRNVVFENLRRLERSSIFSILFTIPKMSVRGVLS